jgi:hypothetical protein
MGRDTQTAQNIEGKPGAPAGALSPRAVTDAPGQIGLTVAGLGVGVLAGALAQSMSESYGGQESSALRVTAHVTVHFPSTRV